MQRKINTFGAGESHVEEKLLDLTRRGHVPEVGITASDATISLRILARRRTRRRPWRQIEPVERTIRERLGDLVFGVEDEELQHAVVRLLCGPAADAGDGRERHRRAWWPSALAQVPGASAWFRGGVVAYDNRVEGASCSACRRALIDEHGAVSAEVAEAMAVGCRTRFGTDLAVSTVGVAGPGGGATDKPVGLVYAALAWDRRRRQSVDVQLGRHAAGDAEPHGEDGAEPGEAVASRKRVTRTPDLPPENRL